MSMKRDGELVHITVTYDEFEVLLLALGIAYGACKRTDLPVSAARLVHLANAINEGNPNWTPYEEAQT